MTAGTPLVSLDAADRSLVLRAREARSRAYAPYSRFAVGAALRTRSGLVFVGCNVENATFGLTLCAERVAIGRALGEGATDLDALAVVVADDQLAVPCGICRELVWRVAPSLRLLLSMPGEHVREVSPRSLLPLPVPLVGEGNP